MPTRMTETKPGDTLPNGAVLEHHCPIPDGTGIILARLEDQFVVWPYYEDDTRCLGAGVYLKDLATATEYYNLQVEKMAARFNRF